MIYTENLYASTVFVAAVANLTRELLIGFNEDGHSGLQFSVGGSEGVISFDQLTQ